jgi:hypothetical protein
LERVKTLKELMQHEEGDVCGFNLARSGQHEISSTCAANATKPPAKHAKNEHS